jgi:hypothetical protein
MRPNASWRAASWRAAKAGAADPCGHAMSLVLNENEPIVYRPEEALDRLLRTNKMDVGGNHFISRASSG